MKKIVLFTIAAGAISACVQESKPEPVIVPSQVADAEYCVPGVVCDKSVIAQNPNKIVLSDESQAEQEASRKKYAELQNQIAQQRVEIRDVSVPETPTVNVAEYAIRTTNQLGVRAYSRSSSFSSKCRSYSSSVDAQRAFLERGGPQQDPLNLDNDGDGFACKFNPAQYRAALSTLASN